MKKSSPPFQTYIMEPYELVGDGVCPDIALKVDVVPWSLPVILTIVDVIVINIILVIDDIGVIDVISCYWHHYWWYPPVRRLSGSKEAPSRKETCGLSEKTVSIFLAFKC